MSELEYPKSSQQWAWEKGLKKKCPHGIEYDPHVGLACEKCKKEENEHRAKREEKKRKLREAFENVVWPDNESQDGK